MVKVAKTRLRWSPQSEADVQLLRESLDEVVRAPLFSGSKRYPALLRYVVEKTLQGEKDSLKERTIGIEVFHRHPDYDTNTDTVVRFSAGEVRKRLLLYYHEAGAETPLQIGLPVGSYVPEFYLATESEAVNADSLTTSAPSVSIEVHRPLHAQRRGRLSFLVLALCLILLGGWVWHRRFESRATASIDAFWKPVISAVPNQPLLICPGAVVLSASRQSGLAVADGKEDPLVSSEIAHSIGQLTDLLGTSHAAYLLRLPPAVTDAELKAHSVILIGAYSNPWTMEKVSHLRYRFSPQPTQSIVDANQPSIAWARPVSWPNVPGNDYGLLARVKDPATGLYTVIIAGLGRSGTEATASFVTSPQKMTLLANRLPKGWEFRNIEVILRTEVSNKMISRDPNVEAIWTW